MSLNPVSSRPRITLFATALFALGAAACTGLTDNTTDTSCSNGTWGAKHKAQFTYIGCRALDGFYLAAVGSKSSIDVHGVTFASAKVADPTIATITYKGSGLSIDVVSGIAGTTTLSLLDGAGAELDSVPLIVKPTTKLTVDRGWGQAAGPTVIAGTKQELHFTTLNGSEVLVGSGAVKFTATGTVKLDTLGANSDSAAFIATTGTGTVVADAAGGGHLEVTVTAIDPTKVTTIDVSPLKQTVEPKKQGYAIFNFSAGDLPVYGATGGCTFTFTGPGTIKTDPLPGSSLSNSPQTIALFTASAPGTYTGTCTVLATKMVSIELLFK